VDIGTVGKEVEELKEPMRADDNGQVMFWGRFATPFRFVVRSVNYAQTRIKNRLQCNMQGVIMRLRGSSVVSM